MDFAFFDSLSPADANAFLETFLRVESSAIGAMVDAATWDDIEANFTDASLPSVILWAIRRAEIVEKLPNEELPLWIRNTDVYQQGLFDFSNQSKPMILRVAYYFGECFVRRFEQLRWSVGDTESAQRNMPVVTGFGDQIELAPILVTENLFRRAIMKGESDDVAIRRTVNRWLAYLER